RARVPVLRVGGRGAREAVAERDEVAVEEPLEVRLGRRSLLVTMRTPGRDLDLVRGLLFTEGLVERAEDVAAVAHCADVPRAARRHPDRLRGLGAEQPRGQAGARWRADAAGLPARGPLQRLLRGRAAARPGPASRRERARRMKGAMRLAPLLLAGLLAFLVGS